MSCPKCKLLGSGACTDCAVKIFAEVSAYVDFDPEKYLPILEEQPPVPGITSTNCEISGNPCGTDTHRVGYECPCNPCRQYRKDMML